MSIAHPIPARITRHERQKLQAALQQAPLYSGKVASALQHTIQVVHGLPKLHATLALKDIEVYIGKSDRTIDAVLRRWINHRKTKKHIFGIILFRCTKQNAKKLEKVALRVVKRLKARNSLCVGDANLSEGSGGRDSANDESLIYMTWSPLETPTAYIRPTITIIREVAKSVAPSVAGFINEAQILKGLMAIKQVGKRKSIRMDYY